MKRVIPALLLVVSFLANAQLAVSTTEVPDLPIDVQRYLDRRASCDHWRSEDGYDAERAREIRIGICKSCGGSDVGLEFLKKQHADDPVVMEQLSALDPSIEDKDMGGHGKMCNDVWPGGSQPPPAATPVSKVKGKASDKKTGAAAKGKAQSKGGASKPKAAGKTATKPAAKSSGKSTSKPPAKTTVKAKAKAKQSA